jgi:hypothetical protein
MDGQPNFFAALSLIVAPAVLTNASTVLIMSTSNRLARAVDRTRDLSAKLESGELSVSSISGHLQELGAAEQRMLMLIRALRIFYIALSGFASAALISLVAAALASVAPQQLTSIMEMVAVVAGLVAVGGLVHGALLLVRETRIAVSVLRERADRLRQQFQERQQNAD